MKIYDCIFLDRDGTINSDPKGYINSLQNFNLYEFTIPALKRLSELGNKFCIITNQSGISRGLIKEENLNFIHDFIYKIFPNINSISIIASLMIQLSQVQLSLYLVHNLFTVF